VIKGRKEKITSVESVNATESTGKKGGASVRMEGDIGGERRLTTSDPCIETGTKKANCHDILKT